ncbi:hypothetical protein MHH60_32545 [Paenibacillus sp. FSL H7-0716]|uniref:Uncharacterized protein n=1 Tax=Paenibacillus odorifer TaxID=189426 RepID=A0AB36J475_9BACL|nr:hypothetical protein [Paenibacillus odorifer]OME10017.1 hypothetical protein BSK47_31460 [Paenibacillus odorifer]
MKKKIIIITTAALMLGGSIGFAATNSPLIGAKVQGLFMVQKSDGTKIGDAVIINGTAYAPVRSVSEATGATLTVEGKKIIMSENNTTSVEITGKSSDYSEKKSYLEYKIRAADSDIKSAQGAIKGLEVSVESVNKLPSEKQKNETLTKIDEMIKVKQQVILEKEKELADLQEQLTEVDAQEAEEGK